MFLIVKQAAQSVRIQVFLADATVTTGAGKTALTNASVTAYYIRDGDAAATSISLSAGTVGTYSSGGFKEIDATNMPGWYEFGCPNGMFTSTARQVQVMIKATGTIVPCNVLFQVTPWDPQVGVNVALPVSVGGYIAGQAPNTLVLKNPSNPLFTDAAGDVVAALPVSVAGFTAGATAFVSVGGYLPGANPATLILQTPANLLVTNTFGQVDIDLAQPVSIQGNVANSVGDCFNAARAQGFGAWNISGQTLQLFGPDGVTAVRTFSLNSATAPTARS